MGFEEEEEAGTVEKTEKENTKSCFLDSPFARLFPERHVFFPAICDSSL
jgi:hypothetical protein